MKKLFFTALVAVVAIGGAFAGNSAVRANGTFITYLGNCVAADGLDASCSTSNAGIQCTAEQVGTSNSGPAYRTRADVSPFACSVPYKLPL